MSTFKQKNVIKSYKLRLQAKLKTVTEETENATSFLNNRVEEFQKRVQHILEIKDEKCLSLYRQLNRDLENFSEKLYILQASFEELTEDESDSSEGEYLAAKLPKTQPENPSSCSSQNEPPSELFSCPEESISVQNQGNASLQGFTENVNLQLYPAENACPQRHTENVNHIHLEESVYAQQYAENTNLQIHPEDDCIQCTEKVNSENNEAVSVHEKENINGDTNEHRCSETNDNYSCNEEDGGNITEDDFYSLHSDSNIHNTDSCILSSSQSQCHQKKFVSTNDCASSISFSQSSCYRSNSSSISESLAIHKENKNNQSVETFNVKTKDECLFESSKNILMIYPPNFEVLSKFSGTLSCIIDPGNFWIQIENSHDYKLSFPKSENAHLNGLSFIKRGNYCLAPFKKASFYSRAQSLSDGKSGKELVKVLFIDHGSTQEVPVWDLRPLPKSAYEVPAQAVHCYLHGIAPVIKSWSHDCTNRFKEFQNFCIEIHVKSKGNLYGVQLIGKLSEDLDEDFSVDIAQALCLDGLARYLDESQSLDHSQHALQPFCTKIDLSLEVSGSYDINAVSNDSGVSVTSAYKSSQLSDKRNESFHKVSEECITKLKLHKDVVDSEQHMPIKDLILFESQEALTGFENSTGALKLTDKSSLPTYLSSINKNLDLHLKIPSPSLLFVEKNMVVVMLCHIVNPNEFYVNMPMEDIINLDVLREQMTCTYDSENNLSYLRISDLEENMFCAGRYYADRYWYRVKILRISPEDIEKKQVLVQYVDYGNTALIQCCDLRPLTLQFAKCPNFAIKCSLVGISPVNDSRSNPSLYWKEEAIRAFKEMTSFERCLTAQICNEFVSNSDAYPVLLWDTKESNDLLINELLAKLEMAVFDYSLLQSAINNHNDDESVTDLDSWDPMLEEYYDTHNNYAYDDEDIEIITSGYRAKDEEYTCKYFSLRGHCPRGSNCKLQHLPLLESGITRDQDEVYCLNTVPINSKTKNVLVQVSAIISPSYFYVVLPFGSKSVDEIDNLVYKGLSHTEIYNSEALTLFDAIDKHYSNESFNENTTIALSCGTIVAAKHTWDGKWHRGRIVDVVGINEKSKVFFVDSGCCEWVPRKMIRTILPQFLHTPFQAVQCSLHGIEPVGLKKDVSWSSDALNYFKDIVDRKVFVAEIIYRLGQVFHVSLTKTLKNNHSDVSQLLVSAGFAAYQKVVPSNRKQTIYVPG